MPHWRYKAFDHELRIHEGLDQANSFTLLAYQLRQKGLQILTAETISDGTAQAEDRLSSMKHRIKLNDAVHSPPTISKSWWQRFLSLWYK